MFPRYLVAVEFPKVERPASHAGTWDQQRLMLVADARLKLRGLHRIENE
jgi:hypothetical protein